jgi:hypothetical protein
MPRVWSWGIFSRSESFLLRAAVFNGAALLAFLALTIAAAYVNLGPFNTVAAMHRIGESRARRSLLHAPPLQQTAHVDLRRCRIFWLAIMLVLALGDYLRRGWH